MTTETPWPTYTHATKYGPLTVTVCAGPTRAPEPHKYADPPRLEPTEPAYIEARIRPPRFPLDTWPHDRIEPLTINGIAYDLDATLRQSPEGTWKPPNGGWPRLRRIRTDGYPSGDPTDGARRAMYPIVDAIAADLPAHTAEARAAELAAADMLRASARAGAERHRTLAALYDALAGNPTLERLQMIHRAAVRDAGTLHLPDCPLCEPEPDCPTP